MLAVVGRRAEAKARACRSDRLGAGSSRGFRTGGLPGGIASARGSVVPGVLPSLAPPFEVMLRVTVRDPNRKAVERFCREFAPLVTSGPSGIAGYATGRPSARPAFGYWPTLVPRHLIEATMEVNTAAEWLRRDL